MIPTVPPLESGCPNVPHPPSSPAGPRRRGRLRGRFLAFGVRRPRQRCQWCPSGACWGRRETSLDWARGLEGLGFPSSRCGKGPEAPSPRLLAPSEPAASKGATPTSGLASARWGYPAQCAQSQAGQRAKIKEMTIISAHRVEGRILQGNLH